MRVSIVMATYNAEAYVGEAIETVLTQSRPPDEFIVIDDGSTDRTRSVLDCFSGHIVVVVQPNRGPTAAVNRAIALSHGDVLGFQDADDLWCAGKLERQLAALEADPALEAVFGLVRQFVSADVPQSRRAALAPVNEIVRAETKLGMLILRTAYDRIGGFDETIRIASMIEWLGRAKLHELRSTTLDEVVALRRLHLGNGGRSRAKEQDDETLLALKRVIATRRLGR
jgi:glycosyltransferase involved in cell wall biosynthesis